MGNFLRFIKQQWIVIAGIACVAVLGFFYFSARSAPKETITAGENTVTIFEAAAAEAEEIRAVPEPEPEMPQVIKVYITGAVVNPGVYEAENGARVDDVLQMAGGPTETADMLRVNLAAYISDAERIIIPEIGAPAGIEEGTEATAADGLSAPDESGGLVNINTASLDQLDTLPGIGPVIAQYVIDYREENGGFKTIEEIQEVNRIGDAVFEQIKEMITVG